MKIRIYIGDQEYIHDIEILDVKAYINILKEYGLIDCEGDRHAVCEVVYDVLQNALDISTNPAD